MSENGGSTENGNGLLSRGLEGLGLGSGGEEAPSSDTSQPAEPGPLTKAKKWSVGAGAAGTAALLAGSLLYWKYAKRPKGRRKKPDGRIGRLVGISGVSLGVSTMVLSGLIFGAAGVAEKKAQESVILRALL